MKPERRSETLLGTTRSKAKMFEYRVPLDHHIALVRDPAELFSVSIGLLGDLAALINSGSGESEEASRVRTHVRFSAQFFDAYCQGQLQKSLDEYLLLVGSAAYYLADLPGSASVLARRLPADLPDLGCSGLDQFTAWLLRGDFDDYVTDTPGAYHDEVEAIAQWMRSYITTGEDENALDDLAQALTTEAYRNGSPRELLFADIAGAIVRTRRQHSSRYSLPRYSDQVVDSWNDALQKETFVRELWPAQRLLGENGVLRGTSGVVQMPTSAGKTRATELIIRSEFIAGRTELAVIVAPFRALCHEIRNSLIAAFQGEAVSVDELTDVFQPDFNIEELLVGKRILVVTPEKLVYVLRHNPELADKIGLLIYDEGHQFDNGSRGVTFELLVTSLKFLIPGLVQTVLISAVITNAEAINEWLNGGDSVVVRGAALTPTFRSIAFASWQDRLGRLEFVKNDDPDSNEFFVPRIIETIELEKKPRERKSRYFPSKEDSPSVALYLGLKLCPSGGVAIFCGRKTTITTLCEMAVDLFERDPPLEKPIGYSDGEEVVRLSYLHEQNLGRDAPTSQCARLGMFAHHGNTPHGIRLAVEHAMRRGTARMVICTSTLAQGVNLPIRYLIVTSTQQGSERITVRDFHNLIGRVGRSGMHTEGSILFANPDLYDKRNSSGESWRWAEIKKLLQPENAEPCVSALLSVFQPLESLDGKYTIVLPPMELLKACMGTRTQRTGFVDAIVARHADKNFTEGDLRYQIQEKWKIITALESYLMAYWEESTASSPVKELAGQTLAFHLAEGDTAQQEQLVALFETIAKLIESKVPEATRRKVFGRTLFGVRDAIAIEKRVKKIAAELIATDKEEDLFKLIWPTIRRHVHNSPFQKCDTPIALRTMSRNWLKGVSFSELLTAFVASGAKIGLGKRPRNPTIDTVVDICENAFAFDGMLTIGAVAEIFEYLYPDEEETTTRLRGLQKRIKYGLKTAEQVMLYEMGFSDRVIAIEVSAFLNGATSRTEIRHALQEERDVVNSAMTKYPSYFREIANRVLA